LKKDFWQAEVTKMIKLDQTDVGKTVDYLAATYQRSEWRLCGHGIDPAHSQDRGNRRGPGVAKPIRATRVYARRIRVKAIT
jgi:hypothetical protein